MEHAAFKPASHLPWSLVVGNIEDNLLALKQAPEATEGTTWKIQQLLVRHTNLQQVALGVDLLRECNWSASTVEQARASVQSLRRHHPDYYLAVVLFR
eukprot:797757-Lingulodinium_polyedra.AAC.1